MFIGQEDIINQILPLMGLDKFCILLRGHFGYGKTVLATALASNCGDYTYQIPVSGRIKIPNKSLIHIIDEVHTITEKFETYYQIFNEGRFLFCTNMTAGLPDAFLSRCHSFTMREYSQNELTRIVVENTDMNMDAAEEVAKRCKHIPRTGVLLAEKLLALKAFTPEVVIETLHGIGVDDRGYDRMDREYLAALENGPMAKRSLAGVLAMPEDELDRIEAVLMRDGLITITSSGRRLR